VEVPVVVEVVAEEEKEGEEGWMGSEVGVVEKDRGIDPNRMESAQLE